MLGKRSHTQAAEDIPSSSSSVQEIGYNAGDDIIEQFDGSQGSKR